MAVAYWFLTLAFGAVAVLSTPRPPRRFSLRRLLVVVALFLGLMGSLPTGRE